MPAAAAAATPAAAPLHVETPLVLSNPLTAALGTGAPVFLKMEALQPCGSFKLRGIGSACQAAVAGGASRLVSSSGGNAGLAVAHAARAMGVPATVVRAARCVGVVARPALSCMRSPRRCSRAARLTSCGGGWSRTARRCRCVACAEARGWRTAAR